MTIVMTDQITNTEYELVSPEDVFKEIKAILMPTENNFYIPFTSHILLDLHIMVLLMGTEIHLFMNHRKYRVAC